MKRAAEAHATNNVAPTWRPRGGSIPTPRCTRPTIVDRVMAAAPGWSKSAPVRFDVWGASVTTHRRNWFSSDDSGRLLDREMQRLAVENGKAFFRIVPRPEERVDLCDVILTDGRNAYET